MKSLLRIFLEEARDLVDELDDVLLETEDNPENAQLLDQFMRKMHSLKGSSATVGLNELSNVAHDIEDLVEYSLGGKLHVSPELFDLLFHCLSVIQRALVELSINEKEPAEITELRDYLAKWQRSEMNQPETESKGTKSMATAFELGEYDLIRIETLEKQGKTPFRIDFAVDDNDAANQAADILSRIRDLGEIVVTSPEEWDFETAAFEGLLKTLIASEQTLDDLASQTQKLDLHPAYMDIFKPEDASSAGETENTGTADAPVLSITTDSKVRVDRSKLDNLLRLSGELVTARSRLGSISGNIQQNIEDNELAANIEEAATRLGQIANEFQDGIIRARLVPMARLMRMVKKTLRSFAKENKKSIKLFAEGEQTEIDAGVIDRIAHPLTELVISIAMEAKDSNGTIILGAMPSGGQIMLSVETDGITVAPKTVKKLQQALAATGGHLFAREGIEGFSADITLPTTLAIIPVMAVTVGNEHYGFPIEDIAETLSIEGDQILTIGASQVLDLRGKPLSLTPLSSVVETPKHTRPNREFVLVVRSQNEAFGVTVDKLLGKRDIVIKALSPRLGNARIIDGANIQGDGSVALVINTENLVQHVKRNAQKRSPL